MKSIRVIVIRMALMLSSIRYLTMFCVSTRLPE